MTAWQALRHAAGWRSGRAQRERCRELPRQKKVPHAGVRRLDPKEDIRDFTLGIRQDLATAGSWLETAGGAVSQMSRAFAVPLRALPHERPNRRAWLFVILARCDGVGDEPRKPGLVVPMGRGPGSGRKLQELSAFGFGRFGDGLC
jgi:hypothetical protein